MKTTSNKRSLTRFALIQVVFLTVFFLPTFWFGRRYAFVLLGAYAIWLALILAGNVIAWLANRANAYLDRVDGPNPPP